MPPFIEAVECLMYNVWTLVTSVEYPGTGIPVAAIFVGAFLAVVAVKIVHSVLNSGGGGSP